MRHAFKVATCKDGEMRPILYTEDGRIARYMVDTRPDDVASVVIDRHGDVIYSNEKRTNTVDPGQ